MTEYSELEDVEIAGNPERRCALCVLLDQSKSMEPKLMALSASFADFQSTVQRHPVARRRLELALVGFGSVVEVAHDFAAIDRFIVPPLKAEGLTPMGAGINLALDLVAARKQYYRENDLSYYRPVVLMLTDGQPQGESAGVLERAAQRVHDGEKAGKLIFWAAGTDDADFSVLSRVSVRPPLRLRGINFAELFLWLSASVAQVLAGGDAQLKLPPVVQSA